MNWQKHKVRFILTAFVLLTSTNSNTRRVFEMQTRLLPSLKEEWPSLVSDSVSKPAADVHLGLNSFAKHLVEVPAISE